MENKTEDWSRPDPERLWIQVQNLSFILSIIKSKIYEQHNYEFKIVESKHECAITCKVDCCASIKKPAAAINQVGRESMERRAEGKIY